MPCGLSQKFGAVWKLEVVARLRALLATTDWVMPTCCGLGAVHGDVQLRLVVGLLNVYVGGSRDRLQQGAAVCGRSS